jgi:hypothetical protein
MNSETIHLAMTPQQADSVAYVLMASLHQTNFMLARERTDAAAASNALFDLLDYGHHTNEKGERLEDKPRRPMNHRRQVKCQSSKGTT